jgi:hypothetical protein
MSSNSTTSNIIDDISDEEFDRMLDEHFSNDHSIRKSIAQTGRHFSEDTKKKISQSRKGKSASSETKLKISNSLKDRSISDEHRYKISIAHIGKNKPSHVCSEDTKKKISEKNRGKPRSDEIKKKISETKSNPIMTDDGPMENCKIAAIFYKVDVTTIRNWVNNKNKKNFYRL